MHQMYYATLKLTCDTHSADMEEFGKRWTRGLERRLSKLTFKRSASIEVALNQRLFQAFRIQMGADTGTVPTGVEALQPGAWSPAPLGKFTQSAVIVVQTPLGSRGWTFEDENGARATLSVQATFEVIDY